MVVEHLKSFCEAKILVAAGGLQRESLPDFDLEVFERAVSSTVEESLKRCGISTSDNASTILLVTLKKSSSGLPEGLVLIETRVELRENATLERKWAMTKAGLPSKVMVTTWQDSQIQVVKIDEAISTLLEMASQSSLKLAQQTYAVGSQRNGLDEECMAISE